MLLAAFNGSSRKNGNTHILLEAVCKEVRAKGIATEIISLCEARIDGCLGWLCLQGAGALHSH